MREELREYVLDCMKKGEYPLTEEILNIQFSEEVECVECGGKGKRCHECDGAYKYDKVRSRCHHENKTDCEDCNGTGKVKQRAFVIVECRDNISHEEQIKICDEQMAKGNEGCELKPVNKAGRRDCSSYIKTPLTPSNVMKHYEKGNKVMWE